MEGPNFQNVKKMVKNTALAVGITTAVLGPNQAFSQSSKIERINDIKTLEHKVGESWQTVNASLESKISLLNEVKSYSKNAANIHLMNLALDFVKKRDPNDQDMQNILDALDGVDYFYLTKNEKGEEVVAFSMGIPTGGSAVVLSSLQVVIAHLEKDTSFLGFSGRKILDKLKKIAQEAANKINN